jgi:GMP synthase-like glutamine amidotransferase
LRPRLGWIKNNMQSRTINMHIRILETGAPPAPLDQEFSAYPAMFERLLAPLAPALTFSATAIHQGGPAPTINEFDGLLITGSAAGVYEGHDWIAPAEELVRRTADAGKPQVGICFGHQLMAQALGGRVEKSDKGWGVGLHDYEIRGESEWMDPAQSRITCAVSHQDQVVEAPPGARILGGSEFCPLAMLDYAQGPAVSFQPHPEFSADYASALLRLRRGRIPAAVADPALATLSGKSDRDLLARWIVNFFQLNAR